MPTFGFGKPRSDDYDASVTYKCLSSTHHNACHVRAVLDNLRGQDRKPCKLALAQEEKHYHHQSKTKQADYRRTIPREYAPTELKRQQEHQDKSEQAKHTRPVKGFYARPKRGLGIVDVQAQNESKKCQPRYRKIDPETPAPRDGLRKDTAE
jgi:hypothetical protein